MLARFRERLRRVGAGIAEKVFIAVAGTLICGAIVLSWTSIFTPHKALAISGVWLRPELAHLEIAKDGRGEATLTYGREVYRLRATAADFLAGQIFCSDNGALVGFFVIVPQNSTSTNGITLRLYLGLQVVEVELFRATAIANLPTVGREAQQAAKVR